jgi:ribosome maturation factor RimP
LPVVRGQLLMKDEIIRLAEETARSLGLMIYESSVLLRGDNTRIVVKIDKLEPVSHLDCERFSKELGAKIDDLEAVPNYTLEVSSPGVKRKLRSIEELRRFIGSPVKIIAEADDKRLAYKGKLVSVEEDRVTVFVDDEDREVVVEYKSIAHANLDY